MFSSDFFIKPLPMRQNAAKEIRRLARNIRLNDIIIFAKSSISGERVASSIALGEKLKIDPACADLDEVRNALQTLFLDRESRVRYRALESISYSQPLIEHFRKRIEESMFDENKSVKDLAEAVLKR